MRRIAIVNQKGGVGKTTTAANLGAALARAGRRVLLIDLDPQGNLSLHLGVELEADAPTVYGVLIGRHGLSQAVRSTGTDGLEIVPANIDLSGAEMELAGALGRERLLLDALEAWIEERERAGTVPDFVLFDCPPSLGLLSINGLVAASEAFIALQTEFFALQGMTQLVDVVKLLKRRLNAELEITGILPCLYDSRLRLAREVLAEIRKYFPGQVFRRAVGTNVKLAEAPGYGQTIFEYAPDSAGARDYKALAAEVLGDRAGEPPGERSGDAPPEGATRGAGTPGDAAIRPSGPGGSAVPEPHPPAHRVVRAEDLPPPAADVFRGGTDAARRS